MGFGSLSKSNNKHKNQRSDADTPIKPATSEEEENPGPIERRVTELNTLIRLSNLLSLAQNLPDICTGAHREIMTLVDALGLSIYLLNIEKDTLHQVFRYEQDEEINQTAVLPSPVEHGYAGYVARSGHILHIHQQNQAEFEHLQSVSLDNKYGAWLGLPLVVTKEIIGVLVVENLSPFSQRDIELLTAVSSSLAIAIYKMVQLEAVQTTLKAQSEQHIQLQTAAEIAAKTTTILDRDQLIHELVNLIRDRFNYYYVGLFLVDEDGDSLLLQAGTGKAGRRLIESGFQLPIDGKSMVSTAVTKGQAHVEQDVRIAKAFHRNELLPNTLSELTLPLRTRGLIMGALTIQSDELNSFPTESIHVLQSLADQLAVAVVNARLFTHLQDNLDQTNRLFEAGRQINAAQTAVDIYQALLEYVRESELADGAFIVTADQTAPDYFSVPTFWRNDLGQTKVKTSYLRDKFPFGERLSSGNLIFMRDSQNDSRLGQLARRLARMNHVRSLVLLPIQIDTEWLATLVLHRKKVNPYNELELQSLITLIDQSAVILSNQQLLIQSETLYQIGRALNHTLTLEDAVDIAVKKVARYTGASQCRFVLYDTHENNGRIISEYHDTPGAKKVRFSTRNEFVFTHLSQTMNPLLLDEKSDVPEACYHQHSRQFGAKATLLVPAISQQDLIGYLAIDSKRDKRPFTKNNVLFTQTVVDYMTTQIENLNLLEEALNRAQDLITLNQVQSGISGILDMTGLAQTVYDQTGRLLDNTIFILARYHADRSLIEPIYCVYDGNPTTGLPQIINTADPIHEFIHGQRHLVAESSHPIMEQHLIPGLKETPQSSIWIPLLLDNQPTGLICLQSFKPDCYSDTDVQLLRSIAIHTSLALANAHLFEEIQMSNEQLRQLDHLKNQFLANMTHELRTPLNSIIGFSRVILKGIDGPLTPAQVEDLTTIYDNGQHLLALINDILDMAKIEAGKMAISFDQIDIAESAYAAMETTRSLVDQSTVQLLADIAPDLPLIEADPIRLRQMLNNLLSNAAKFTNDGQITLSITHTESYVNISVEDTGIGIEEKDYESLFIPFEQVQNRDSRFIGGTGLGLPITQWLVRTHNGRIWVESKLDEGSTFHIQLPLNQPDNSPPEVSLNEPPITD